MIIDKYNQLPQFTVFYSERKWPSAAYSIFNGHVLVEYQGVSEFPRGTTLGTVDSVLTDPDHKRKSPRMVDALTKFVGGKKS